MVKKGKIAEYRETLDKTLARDDLIDDKRLEALVKDQILRSSEGKIRDYIDNVVEKRTSEVSNFLEMLRSASENYQASDQTHHASWKLKQDTEEFRVMYREGPVGSPFHSLLVEGYIDAPLDVCLCVSWETALYPRWFPDMLIPTFKVIAAQSLQKVMIGEEISLMRVKLSWPMSSREAILHYFEFEFLEDGLIVVLMNTIPDVDDIQMQTHGFTSEGIPEAGNTVRMDLVGGFALQRVTESRSYFRTIGNVDVKLDFVPPSLINFISRQLIGSGFRFYQKTVASVSKGDEAFAQVLRAPLYSRIREAVIEKREGKSNAQTQKIQDCTTISNGKQKPNVVHLPRNDYGEVLGTSHTNNFNGVCGLSSNEIEEESQGRNSTKYETPSEEIVEPGNDNVLANGHVGGCLQPYKPASEIEEEASRGSVDKIKKGGSVSTDRLQIANFHQNVHISPQVEKALGTLDKMIDAVRQGRLKAQASGRYAAQIVGGEATFSTSAKHVQWTDEQGISAEQVVMGLAPGSGKGITPVGLRSLKPNFHAHEANLDEQPTGSWSRNALSAGNSPIVDSSINLEVNNIHVNKKSGHSKKWRLCCLHQFLEGWSRDTDRKENTRSGLH